MRRETRILKGKKKYVFNWQMSSVLGGGGSRVKAYMVDSTGPQSAVEARSPACINVSSFTGVGGATQVSTAWETAPFYSALT